MGKNYKIEFHGPKVIKEMREIGIKGVRDVGYAILNDSSAIVPHREGILEASGSVYVDTDKIEAYISYDTPYAIRQHEDTTARHTGGRSAKYLEKPLMNRGKELLDMVAADMKARFG